MPSASDITLSPDGGTTSHVFSPVRVSPELTEHKYSAASAPSSQWARLTSSLSPATPQRKTNRVKFQISVPKVETVDGIDVVVSTGRVYVDAIVPDDFDTTDRTTLVEYGVSALDNAVLKGYVIDLEPQY